VEKKQLFLNCDVVMAPARRPEGVRSTGRPEGVSWKELSPLDVKITLNTVQTFEVPQSPHHTTTQLSSRSPGASLYLEEDTNESISKTKASPSSSTDQLSSKHKAWIYPELPWGAPPSWKVTGRLGGTFLIYWECFTCLGVVCVFVCARAITVCVGARYYITLNQHLYGEHYKRNAHAYLTCENGTQHAYTWRSPYRT
jgi:hypothetical protein